MKIRALVNGEVIDANADAAKQLIDAGIYEAVGESKVERPVQAKLRKP